MNEQHTPPVQTQKKIAYGGQAVIEGVMMRGRHKVAVAVRNPKGEIVVYEETLNANIYRSEIAELPFLRGAIMKSKTRRWKMATLCIDTAGAGPAEHKIHVRLLDASFARQELQAIAREASLRRAALR